MIHLRNISLEFEFILADHGGACSLVTKELEIMRRVTVTQHLDTTRQAHLMLTLTWTNNLKLCENLLTLIAIVWILEGAF